MKPRQAYLSRDGIQKIKSVLTNDIFKQEMLHTYEQKSASRDELVQAARRAMLKLARSMREGICDHPDAEQLMLKLAARQGHPAAQYSLAQLYLSDDIEVRDTEKGMEWLHIAADGGNRYAMYRLAKEYLKGDLIDRNPKEAVEWFTRSAERGNMYAQYMLGKLYLAGQEVPQNSEQAIYWLTQSAEQGNRYARFLLDHQDENRPLTAMLAMTRLLHHMGRVFRDNSVSKSLPGGIRIDRKRLAQLREKKIAMGHKADDHEDPSQGSMTMG